MSKALPLALMILKGGTTLDRGFFWYLYRHSVGTNDELGCNIVGLFPVLSQLGGGLARTVDDLFWGTRDEKGSLGSLHSSPHPVFLQVCQEATGRPM